MLDYSELFEIEPYGLGSIEKSKLYDRWLSELQAHHCANCSDYDRLVKAMGDNPALPVRLFKELDLRSIDAADVVKTMTSSGTTGQQKSKINLDRETSARQSKTLIRIVGSFLESSKRVPMLVIDAAGTVKNRSMFSARTAGIRGFSMMGRDVSYALTDDMTPDFDEIERFFDRHSDEQVLLFGFTYMIWSCLVQQMLECGKSFDFNGLLVHGGGWKKLVDQAVSSEEFADGCKTTLGKSIRVSDYYGMVEQTGSINMECEYGHLHTSIFSDVEICDPLTLESIAVGERGIIKSISLLPTSYPGHILLTEDEGMILGEDDCPCGRKGRYFKVFGRQKGAEIRGCSDTYGN